MVDLVTGATLSNEVAAREGELIEQDGVRYKIISIREAFDMRLDVQLYEVDLLGQVYEDQDPPEEWRRCYTADIENEWGTESAYVNFDAPYWMEYRERRIGTQWAIEIDPDKPEYVCPT
jgi:hypothetical protein